MFRNIFRKISHTAKINNTYNNIRCLGYARVLGNKERVPVFHKDDILEYLSTFNPELSEKEVYEKYKKHYLDNSSVLVLEDSPYTVDEIITNKAESELEEYNRLIKNLEL